MSDPSVPALPADPGPDSGREVEVLATVPLHQGFFRMIAYTLRHRLYSGGWSAPMTREIFERGDAVGILLYDPDRDVVVLVEQFRVGTLRHGGPHWMVEIVAGIRDESESAEDVARREAREEAGCTVGAVERIGAFYPSPGGCTERFTLFCGRVDSRGISGIHGLAEEHEDIRVLTVPADAAIAALDQDLIRNGITLVALGWLARHRDRLRRQWADPA